MTHPAPDAGTRSRSLPADITVPNPDDPFGPPIYEGPSAEAGQHLVPGTYPAVHQADIDHVYEVVVDDNERAALFHTGTGTASDTAGTVTPEARAAATPGEWADAEAVAAEARPADPPGSGPDTGDQPEAGDDPKPAPSRSGARDGIRLTVTGNLSADPESGYNQAGQAWIRLTVASAERYRDTAGRWRTGDTQFTPVLLFGKAAETLINADIPLAKGSRIEATGRPLAEPFKRTDGTVSVELKVLARSIGRPDLEPKAPTPPVEPPGKRPTIHHNPDHTIATGVGRDDVAVRTALKAVGFTWSSPRKVWHLPASMPAAERQERIDQAAAKLSESGTGPGWDITSAPAPGTAAAARATNTAGLGAGQFTPEPFASSPRSGPSRS